MRSVLFLFLFLILGLILFLNIISVDYFSALGKTPEELKLEEQRKEETKKLQEDILLWQHELAEKPNYRDVYLKLAVLNWRLHRRFEAFKFVQEALQIDPNYQEALNLQKAFLEEENKQIEEVSK